jgi:hypothetical protein
MGAAVVTHGLIRKSSHLVDHEDPDLDREVVQVPHTSHTNTAPNYPPRDLDQLGAGNGEPVASGNRAPGSARQPLRHEP